MTLTVVDRHCATNVFPELCTLGFLQPSGLRSLPVCLWKVGVLRLHVAAADRHGPHTDAATTVWVCIFVEYSAALAVLDFLEQENVFPELCKLGISQPSGLLAAFRSAHEEPKQAAGLNTAQFFTQQGMDFTRRSIWPVTK